MLGRAEIRFLGLLPIRFCWMYAFWRVSVWKCETKNFMFALWMMQFEGAAHKRFVMAWTVSSWSLHF